MGAFGMRRGEWRLGLRCPPSLRANAGELFICRGGVPRGVCRDIVSLRGENDVVFRGAGPEDQEAVPEAGVVKTSYGSLCARRRRPMAGSDAGPSWKNSGSI